MNSLGATIGHLVGENLLGFSLPLVTRERQDLIHAHEVIIRGTVYLSNPNMLVFINERIINLKVDSSFLDMVLAIKLKE